MHPIRLPKRPKGPWRAVVAVLLDVVIAAGIALSVYYFNYRVPQRFALPSMAAQGTLYAGGPLQPEGSSAGSLPLEGKFADRFSDTVTTTDTSYRSKDLSITVTAHTLGKGSNRVAYYVADVYTTNIRCFRTYFSQDTYGSGFEEHLTKMSRDV